MNEMQRKAANNLQRALRKCESAGLQGAVFEGTVCVWPADLIPHPQDDPRGFEQAVRYEGMAMAIYKMWWDGATA